MEGLMRSFVDATLPISIGVMDEGLLTDGAAPALLRWARKTQPPYPPLLAAPCAGNVARQPCGKPGTKVCSGCRLVLYCSTVGGYYTARCTNRTRLTVCIGVSICALEDSQTRWALTRLVAVCSPLPYCCLVCKDSLLSPEWKPAWKVHDYKPSFSPNDEAARDRFRQWATTPPVDIVNLKMNENDTKQDLTLAFVDSGDIRSIVKTINSLPEDYAGKVEILVNDPDGVLAIRNLGLVLLLGDFPNDELAVETAIHSWVSAVMPVAHATVHNTPFLALRICEGAKRVSFGSTGESSVGVGFSVDGGGGREEDWFTDLESSIEHLSPERFVPNTKTLAARRAAYRASVSVNDRDRVYAQVAPAVRMAVKRYEDEGVVFPFGFEPEMAGGNFSLVSLSEAWIPPAGASPLQGWDLNEVVETGVAYGTQPEDIYGCLFFHLAAQLREFRRRIRERFRIAFRFTSLPAAKLAEAVARYRPGVRFDRVDLGRSVDHGKVGVEGAVRAWAGLVAKQKDAAVVGVCRTWVNVQKDGKVKGAGDERYRGAVRSVVENMKTGKAVDEVVSDMGQNERLFYSVCHNIEMGYDNSTAFASYLATHAPGLGATLSEFGMKSRSARRIVPHRVGVPLEAPESAIPEVKDEEAWYRATMMNSVSWSERYLEFGRG